ncbi:hypothetical protein Asp14428_12840 [Actinoplanes sp. NBRC 14428]|nr:hypothetical protein Asp14428_12840 [Actinoplanes sp. NBRC 14428]
MTGAVAGLRALVALPAGLRSRIRYAGLALCLACLTLVAVLVLLGLAGYPPPQRAGILAGLGFLAWWWVGGYQRKRFPTAGFPLEIVVLTMTCTFLGASALANPLLVGSLLFRSLYGRLRDLGLLLAGWITATLGSLVLSVRFGFEDAVVTDAAQTVLTSAVTITILASLMFWVSYAAGRYELLVRRESALNTAAVRLATATHRDEIRSACLETLAELVGDEQGPVGLDIRLRPGPRVPETGVAGRRHTFHATIASRDTAYGEIAVLSRRPLAGEIRQPIESLAATCAMALRALGLADDLRHRAFHDALTGLANRDLFLQRAGAALTAGRPDPPAIVMIDLDGFKPINDRYGHAAGDQVLRAVAQRMNGEVRAGDVAARLGGDEFAILLEDAGTALDPARFASRLLQVIAEPIVVGGVPLTVGASIGVAVRHGHRDVDHLMNDADAAMYSAKRAGKNRVSVALTGRRVAAG